MQSNQRILRHPGLLPLWQSVAREHRNKQLTSVVMVTIGLLAAVFGVGSYFWVPFAGAAVATWGAFWLFRLLGSQPVLALRRDLREEPEKFVWVYGLVTERMPFGLNLSRAGVLYLFEDSGQVHDFSLKAEHLLLVTKTLNRLLPKAEFGYTEERELKYRGELTRPK